MKKIAILNQKGGLKKMKVSEGSVFQRPQFMDTEE